MSWTRPQTFRPGDFLRPCDICSIRYLASELRKGEDGFWRCVRYCLEVPSITRDKISAESQRRKEAPPPPHGIPFDRKHTYAEEALVFNLIAETPVRDPSWPGGLRLGLPPHELIDVSNGGPGAPAAPLTYAQYTPATSYSFNATAEAMRYLYNVIVENKRPVSWIAAAKTKLKQLADWLITQQSGIGTRLSDGALNNFQYGSFYVPGLFSGVSGNSGAILSEDVAGCGLGLLYAYRIFGTASYLASAQAAATYLRNVQASGSSWTTLFTAANSAGTTRLYTGAIMRTVAVTDSSPAAALGDQLFFPSQLIALEFFNELLTTAGNGTYGSLTTGGGFFTASPAATLTTMIADLRAFWAVGAFDATAGVTINGLSATTPREVFAAFCGLAFSMANSGSWEYQDAAATMITGANFAKALRSLYAFEGFSSQVSSVWNWLMSFASNTAFMGAAGSLPTDYSIATGSNSVNPTAPPVGQGNIIAPSYDPTKALTTLLLVRAGSPLVATAQNGSATYDWSTAGYMAAIQSAQAAGSFRKAKDTVVVDRLRLPVTLEAGATPITDEAMLRGQSGLAYQLSGAQVVLQDYWNSGVPAVTTGSKFWNAASAAVVGSMFRYQPQAFVGAPAPGQPYSQAPPGVAA